MEYWNNLFNKTILNIKYEDVISNPKKKIEELINFCQLDWEEECLNFHSTKREVNTASAVQVRKPIYKTSVNLWEKYKENLNPLIKELNAGEE